MFGYFWDSMYSSMKFLRSLWKKPAFSDYYEAELLEKQLAVYREIPHKPIRLYLYKPP